MRETAAPRQLLLPALSLLALFSPAACLSTSRARRPALRHAARAPLVRCAASGNEVDRELEVWRFREGVARGSYGALVNWREDGREDDEARSQRPDRDSGEATKSAFIASATAVVVGALILRLGGRAALVSVLGLDVVADLGIGDQIDSVIGYVSALGPLGVVGFLAAWVVTKTLMLDFIGIGLAFSSGILFGGVFEGAAISALGATLGSLVAFGLSRTLLQQRVDGALEKQPVARALAKVVEADGFKTVFVLRLAPLVPIPLGAYSYVYGASKLSPVPFAAGTFLGSIKPYLLDSYLGVFSKQIIDGDSLDSTKDLLLLVGLGALVLVGAFASDLAAESWEKVQDEVKAENLRRVQAGEDAAEESGELVLGPFNSTAATASFLEKVPPAARREAFEVWEQLGAFFDDQWTPAAQFAVAERLRRKEEELQRLENIEVAVAESQELEGNSNKVERLLASLATPAESEGAEGKRGGLWGRNEENESEEERAARLARAEWALGGPRPWRSALSSLFFSFALIGAVKKQWDGYPLDRPALDELVQMDTTKLSPLTEEELKELDEQKKESVAAGAGKGS